MDLSQVPIDALKAELLRRKDNPELRSQVGALAAAWVEAEPGRGWASTILYCGTANLDSAAIAIIAGDGATPLERHREAVSLGDHVGAALGIQVGGYLFDASRSPAEALASAGWVEVFSCSGGREASPDATVQAPSCCGTTGPCGPTAASPGEASS